MLTYLVYTEDVEASLSQNAPFSPQDIGTASVLEAENAVNCIRHASPAGPEVTELSELENAVLQQIASLQSAVKLQGLQSATVRAQNLKNIYRSLISHTKILTSGHESSESTGEICDPENSATTFTTQSPALQNTIPPNTLGPESCPDHPDEDPFGQQVGYGNESLTLDWDYDATQLENWDIERLSSFSFP